MLYVHINNWVTFVSSVEGHNPQPHAHKILNKLDNNINENVTMNSIPHGTWLNYFHVDESCNM
jgi:hypothetical protein